MSRVVQSTESMSTELWGLTTTIDLFDLLWRRKYIVIGSVVVGVAAGLGYFFTAAPLFESSADVLLVEKRPDVVTQDPRFETGFADYVATHQALIVSPMIVQRAVEASKLGSLKTFADADPNYPLSQLIVGQLLVSGGPRELGENADSIMTLAYQGDVPEDCPVIVQSVVDSYRSFLAEMYRDLSTDSVRLIGEARDLLQHDLQSQEDAYIQFRQQSPLVTRGADEVNPLQDRLAAIETQRSDLLIRQAEIEGQLVALENARRDSADDATMLALLTDLRSQNDAESSRVNLSTSLDNQIAQLADREQQLLQLYGPNHPHVATIRDRIATTQSMQAMPRSSYVSVDDKVADDKIQSSVTAAVDTFTKYLRQELDRVQVSARLLEDLYQREHETAKELSSFQLKDERFRRNIDRTQQLYDGVVSQLQDAGLIRDYGGFEARVIAAPQLGERVHPRGKIAVAGGGLLGSLLGLFLAIVAELRDKSLRSRKDVQARLGLPVWGQIPHLDADLAPVTLDAEPTLPLDPILRTHFAPTSPDCEAFRRLRTALLFRQSSTAANVIQFTGPSPDDGTSSVVANLAVSLAQLGRRVLLMDADLHRPRQHKIFGIVPERGLSCVLAARESAEDATYRTEVDHLWLLPAGPKASDSQDAFASSRFTQLLAELRDAYDLVLIDSEPLLAISDPCVIAAQVDRVVMVLRPTKDSRWRAERAKEILDAVGVEPSGIVINDIGASGARRYRDGQPLPAETYATQVGKET